MSSTWMAIVTGLVIMTCPEYRPLIWPAINDGDTPLDGSVDLDNGRRVAGRLDCCDLHRLQLQAGLS